MVEKELPLKKFEGGVSPQMPKASMTPKPDANASPRIPNTGSTPPPKQ